MNSIGILSCGFIYSSVNRVWYHSSLSDLFIKGDYKKVKFFSTRPQKRCKFGDTELNFLIDIKHILKYLFAQSQ